MVLETMFWPDEIRSVDQLDLPSGKAAAPQSREVDMARTLIESLASHFEPDQYRDEFRGALLDLIERKMTGEQRSAKRRKPEPKVVDLMEALQASLASAKTGRASSERSASKTRAASKCTPREPAAQSRLTSAVHRTLGRFQDGCAPVMRVANELRRYRRKKPGFGLISTRPMHQLHQLARFGRQEARVGKSHSPDA